MRFISILGAAVVLSAAAVVGCSHEQELTPASADNAEKGAAQQAIVERAAAAFARMKQNPRFSTMTPYLEKARAVMIFPRVVKASLIFGGEGGNGVMVARAPDGSWSDPAFYSLGAPSVGLQVGYQEATVVLFFMEQQAVEQALHSEFTLGTSSSAALGEVGERGQSDAEVMSKPIYQLVEAGGAFAGVSLNGYVIGSRNKHNSAYYGAAATPRSILIERSLHRADADVLKRALSAK